MGKPKVLFIDRVLTFVRHLNDKRLPSRSIEFLWALDSGFRLAFLHGQLAGRAELSGLTQDLTVVFHLQFVEDELVFASTKILYFDSERYA